MNIRSLDRATFALIRNLLLGLAISLLLWRFQDIAFVVDAEDVVIDLVSQLQLLDPSPDARPIGLIDVDVETWSQLGNPAVMPRDALIELMTYLTAWGASHAVIDVDLSGPARFEGDADMRAFLADYQGETDLILVKRMQGEADRRRPVTSFLDSAVAANARVSWASALYNVDDSLQVRSAELINLVEGQPFPSVQRLILAGTDDPARAATLNQKIFFRFPWDSDPGFRLPRTRAGSPLFSVRSARPIIEAPGSVDGSWLQDRIVVLGVSASESDDRYLTSLGQMPGFAIIANAIHSYAEFGEIRRPHLAVTLIITIAVIAVMSYLFSRFSSLVGLIVSSLIIVFCLVPICLAMLSQGVWFNLVVPILTVQVLHILFRLEEMFGRQRK